MSKVYAVTLIRPHTCSSAAAAPQLLEEAMDPNSSEHGSAPSSASALQRAGAFGRRLPASQLAKALRPGFEQHGRGWTGKHVFAEIRKVDPSASMSMAYQVLSRLRKPVVLSPAFNTILLQGLASALRREGWGVVLHSADAASVRHQIEDIARKQYAAHCRANPECKNTKFDAQHIAAVLEKYASPAAQETQYVMGFTLVPPHIMSGALSHFPPVDAIDGANMRADAAGVMINRATKDGNDNIHLISTSVLLASECNLSMDAVQSAESLLLGADSALDLPGRVTITDGGIALVSSQRKHRPLTALWRCYRHLKADLLKKCKKSAEILDALVKVPPGRVHSADALMEKLPASSPLHSIPKECFCQAYLRSDVCLHGNITNNMVEITNHLMAGARTQSLLFRAMQSAADTVKLRMVSPTFPSYCPTLHHTTCQLSHSRIHVLTHSLTHSLTSSLINSLTHSRIHALTH